MKTYYELSDRSFHDILEIEPMPYTEMSDFMIRTTQKMLPNDICFVIKHGKRKTDMISHYSSSFDYYSQNFIDVLSKFMDMSDKCYPINIEGIDEKYYVIYNLKGYEFFNRKEHFFKGEPTLFLNEGGSTPPLFTYYRALSLVVSEEIKQEIEKQKLKYIQFKRVFSYSKPEYEAWKKFWGK